MTNIASERNRTRDRLLGFYIDILPLIPQPTNPNIMPFLADFLFPVFDI